MKVIGLKSNNFKRLKAIDITPKDFQIITGRNAQGKSSLIDSIIAALQYPGKKDLPKPVRNGQKNATVEVRLGDKDELLTVTRTFRASGSTELEVVSKDDGRLSSPQAVLDELFGTRRIDPKEFVGLGEREQVRIVLLACGKETVLRGIEADRKAAYDERTLVNRDIKRLEASLPPIPPDEVEKIDVTDIHHQIREMRVEAQTYRDNETFYENVTNRIQTLKDEISQLEGDIKDLDKYFDSVDFEPDKLEALEQRLVDAGEINRKALNYEDYVKDVSELQVEREKSEECSKTIRECDENKAELLSNLNLPVDGLSFNEDGITLNNTPLKQWSESEQLKIGTALALEHIPQDGIRVVFLKGGPALDGDSKQMIYNMCKEQGVQVILEDIVHESFHPETGDMVPDMDTAKKIGIVIEDGEVVK